MNDLKKDFLKTLLDMNDDEVEQYDSGKIPIYRGCPNSGSPCFCTGACREIIGWREPHPLERRRDGHT